MPSGSSILKALGISEGDRVHMRNPDPKVRSILKWDLHDSCELVETNGDGYPYPPIDVSLVWLHDDDDVPAVLEAMRDRVPDAGRLWAVIRAKKHQEEGRTADVDDVAKAAKAAGLKVGSGAMVNLSDAERAVPLLPGKKAKSKGKSKSKGKRNGKGGSKGKSGSSKSKGKGKGGSRKGSKGKRGGRKRRGRKGKSS